MVILLSVALLTQMACDPIELIEAAEFVTDVADDSVTFAVIGDYGEGAENEHLVADMVKSWNPDFIITTGDNNYPDGSTQTLGENITEYYGDYIYNFDAEESNKCNGLAFKEKMNRFFPSPGNHDKYNSNDLIPYLNYFTLPGNEIFYKFYWGDIAFFSLNSTERNMDEQKTWLEKEILISDKVFNIVYFHHSPYSTGDHGNEPDMQWDFYSMGFDLVITGHDHLYSRIEKMDEPGLHYIVNGIGGKSKYSCGKHPLNTEEFSVKCYDENYGALKVRASKERLVLEFFSIDKQEVAFDVLIID